MDKQRLHHGNLISLYKQKIDLPNGDHTYYDIVEHPGGAVIAAVNALGEICFITQQRPAVGGIIWELPAGCLEPNEPPMETAKRELEEETGWIAENWSDMGTIVTTPGFCDEVLHIFVATDLTETATNFDAEEQIEIHWLAASKVTEMVRSGEINDAKTLSLLYRMQLNKPFSELFTQD